MRYYFTCNVDLDGDGQICNGQLQQDFNKPPFASWLASVNSVDIDLAMTTIVGTPCGNGAGESGGMCPDTDGDGWIWNGSASCVAGKAPVATPGECVDSDGDGWVWDAKASCRIE